MFVHLTEVLNERLPANYAARNQQRLAVTTSGDDTRDRLTAIPIPLRSPDPDVPLDLARAYTLAYNRGRYELDIPYR